MMNHLLVTFAFVLTQTANAFIYNAAPTTSDLDTLRTNIRTILDNGPRNNQGRRLLLPPVVRLGFHDCVGGSCDGCLNLGNPGNNGLGNIVTTLDTEYVNNWNTKLSRADFWALSATIAAEYGAALQPGANPYEPTFEFSWGRQDCATTPTTTATNTFPNSLGDNSATLAYFLANFGLDAQETTALMGAHTLGRASIPNSGFSGPWVGNIEALNNRYFQDMLFNAWQQQIPAPPRGQTLYRWNGGPQNRRLMLNADMSLRINFGQQPLANGQITTCPNDPDLCANASTTIDYVEMYAFDNELWLDDFALVWEKMLAVGNPTLYGISASAAIPAGCPATLCAGGSATVSPSASPAQNPSASPSANPSAGATQSPSATTTSNPATTPSTSPTTSRTLKDPMEIDLQDGAHIVLEAKPFQFQSSPNGLVDFMTRAWCYQGTCSVPGPTLLMHPGTTVTVEILNSIPSAQPTIAPTQHPNTYHSPDSINLHTHGLHVSPFEDDVLTLVLPNSNSRNYTYTIPSNHYEGTLWYHTHYHGNTFFGVSGGMAGFLLMQRNSGLVSASAEWDGMQSHLMILQPFDLTAACPTGSAVGPGFTTYTLCDAYWFTNYQNPAVPWNAAQNIDTILVNGQEQPEINMAPGEWRRFRVLNAGPQHWMIVEMVGCEMRLLGFDGIFFPAGPRTETYVVMSPARRADIAVMCATAGTYAFQHNQGNRNLAAAPIYPTNPFVLVTVIVSGTPVVETDPLSLSPPSPFPAYLADTTGVLGVTVEKTWQLGGPQHQIDGQSFDGTSTFTFPVDGLVHEWTIQGAWHPYHQHTHHFQLQADVVIAPSGTVVARAGDWADVHAGPPFTMRFWATTFTGTMVIHCHFLDHEDRGMMTLATMEAPTVPAGFAFAVDSPKNESGLMSVTWWSGLLAVAAVIGMAVLVYFGRVRARTATKLNEKGERAPLLGTVESV